MTESITELKIELSLAVAYLIVNNEDKFKIPADLLKRLKENLADWEILEAKYNDVNQRTKVVTDQFAALRKNVSMNLREMKQFIKHGILAKELTTEDRDNLGIPEDKKRHTIPRPTLEPLLTVVSQSRRKPKIQVSTTRLPSFNHRNLPEDVKSVYIYIVVREVTDETVPIPEEYNLFKIYTTVTFDMELPEEYIGKVIYVKAAFANEKAEEGNRGAAIKIVVSN